MITRILKIVILLLGFIMVVLGSAYFTLTRIIKSEDTVVVPALEGKEIVYALELLTGLGLNTKVKGSEYSSDIPKHYIIFQEPDPGTELKKGRDIRVILSKGTKTVVMPNLSGISLPQARIILEENDLYLGKISYTYIKYVEKEHIITHVPYPGIRIKRDGRVDVLVSSGARPKTCQMPDLKGNSLDEAMLAIEKHNLIIGKIRTLASRDMPENTIIGQEPLFGHQVTEGSRVNLIINKVNNKGDQPDWVKPKGFGLFKYNADIGFLNTHIRVRLNSYGISMDVFNGFLRPGEEIWCLIPDQQDTTLFLYKNDELIKAKVYD